MPSFKRNFFLNVLLFFYPFAVFCLRDLIPSVFFILGVTGLLFLRSLIPLPQHLEKFKKPVLSLSVLLSLLLLSSYMIEGDVAILYYPVLMSFSIALLFLFSFVYPPSLITCLALITEPSLDEKGVRYTRFVTLMWGVFCLLNGLASYVTVILENVLLWTLYNGCISYILMGLLFLGEYGIRRIIRRPG